MFSIFMLLTIFGQLSQQILPLFVTQRALYEARERPSKTYSWKAFIISNIVVELPWNFLAGVIIFFCWYYPIGLYRNAIPDDQVHERGGLMFLYGMSGCCCLAFVVGNKMLTLDSHLIHALHLHLQYHDDFRYRYSRNGRKYWQSNVLPQSHLLRVCLPRVASRTRP